MTTKDVIAQAEIKFDQKFNNLDTAIVTISSHEGYSDDLYNKTLSDIQSLLQVKQEEECDCVCHTIKPLKRGEAYPRQFDRPVSCKHCQLLNK